jgi:hypothetical protein
MRRAERSQGDMQLVIGDANVACGGEQLMQRAAHRWGMTTSEIDYHGGKAAVRRPRVRKCRGAELELSSWQAIKDADLLSRWAFNQMLIGVATRKYAHSVRLPEGDLADQAKRRHDEVLGVAAVRGAEHGEVEGGWRPTCLGSICW